MLYHHLFNRAGGKETVTAAVIGAGHYGAAIVTQQNYVKRLKVPLVADIDADAAKTALLKAGIPEELIVYAATSGEACDAIASGKFVYTGNGMIPVQIPDIDVIAEATGVPEASARFCIAAIENGKHVAAVSKETDSAIGPMLRKLAADRGVVYSPVDGDQPALLMGLVEWARQIGLTVLSAGKARDAEFVLNEKTRTISVKADGITVHKDAEAEIPGEYMKYFGMIPEGKGMAELYLAKRDEVLSAMPGAGAFDLCELTMMANALGLKPFVPETRKACLRITELPIAYCPQENGGLFDGTGILDVLTTLRRADESGMGGGVFMVVRCENDYSNYILTTKGQIANYDNSAAVIYRPYHLCGVETSTTILAAGLLGMDTGSLENKPSYDLVKVAACDIKCGEKLGGDHDLRLEARIIPAICRAPENPVPGHMLNGRAVVRDIKKGEMITYSDIDCTDSLLWNIRTQQEKYFGI